MASKISLLRARTIGAITPHNSTELSPYADSIVCGAAGNAVVIDLDGNSTTIPMVAGQVLPVGVKRIHATGTTGTYFGLYE